MKRLLTCGIILVMLQGCAGYAQYKGWDMAATGVAAYAQGYAQAADAQQAANESRKQTAALEAMAEAQRVQNWQARRLYEQNRDKD